MQVVAEPTTLEPFSGKEKPNGRARGLRFSRRFTERGVSPYDQIAWEIRDAAITDEHGETIFAQHAVECPKSWSQMATTIVASKYFHGSFEAGERESSVRQLIGRVVGQLFAWGVKDGYFMDREAAETFRDELTFLLLHQHASFNSPVWFQLRHRGAPAVLGVFHQLGRGHHGLDPDARQDRGDAFQVGFGHRHEPVQHPKLAGAAIGGRYGIGAGLVHEGLRLLRRSDPQRRPRRAAPPRW